MQALGAGHDQRELDLVNVGDGLEHFEGGVLRPVLDPKHVRIVASHSLGDVLIRPATLYAQVGNHSAERSLWRVASAFQWFDWTTHATSSAIDSSYISSL